MIAFSEVFCIMGQNFTQSTLCIPSNPLFLQWALCGFTTVILYKITLKQYWIEIFCSCEEPYPLYSYNCELLHQLNVVKLQFSQSIINEYFILCTVLLCQMNCCEVNYCAGFFKVKMREIAFAAKFIYRICCFITG